MLIKIAALQSTVAVCLQQAGMHCVYTAAINTPLYNGRSVPYRSSLSKLLALPLSPGLLGSSQNSSERAAKSGTCTAHGLHVPVTCNHRDQLLDQQTDVRLFLVIEEVLYTIYRQKLTILVPTARYFQTPLSVFLLLVGPSKSSTRSSRVSDDAELLLLVYKYLFH